MKNLNKIIGSFGENLAIKFLKNKGYIILEKNFYCPFGEIDIIAKDGSYLVFIEVKTRYNFHYGTPLESINFNKQNKIKNVAKYYLINKHIFKAYCRFDALEIILKKDEIEPKINLIRNAFF